MDTIQDDTTLHALLSELHKESEEELIARARSLFKGTDDEFGQLARQYETLAAKNKGRFLSEHGLSIEGAIHSPNATLSLSVSPEMGDFLHNLVLAVRPKTVLELGSSRGVSTLYLAAAVRRLGGGKVIATEISPEKCSLIRNNLARAGLTSYVDIREGDAFDTIATFEEPLDFIFLDVFAGMYLPVIQKIERLLKSGTVIVADNMFTSETELKEFKTYLTNNSAWSTTTMNFESGVEFLVVH